jgi:hypothetical protein
MGEKAESPREKEKGKQAFVNETQDVRKKRTRHGKKRCWSSLFFFQNEECQAA